MRMLLLMSAQGGKEESTSVIQKIVYNVIPPVQLPLYLDHTRVLQSGLSANSEVYRDIMFAMNPMRT